MASTITAADLKVKITEEIILNGKDRGSENELTIGRAKMYTEALEELHEVLEKSAEYYLSENNLGSFDNILTNTGFDLLVLQTAPFNVGIPVPLFLSKLVSNEQSDIKSFKYFLFVLPSNSQILFPGTELKIYFKVLTLRMVGCIENN